MSGGTIADPGIGAINSLGYEIGAPKSQTSYAVLPSHASANYGKQIGGVSFFGQFEAAEHLRPIIRDPGHGLAVVQDHDSLRNNVLRR